MLRLVYSGLLWKDGATWRVTRGQYLYKPLNIFSLISIRVIIHDQSIYFLAMMSLKECVLALYVRLLIFIHCTSTLTFFWSVYSNFLISCGTLNHDVVLGSAFHCCFHFAVQSGVIDRLFFLFFFCLHRRQETGAECC